MFVFCSVYFSIHLAYQRQCIFTCRMRLRIHRSIFCVSFTINNFKLFLNKQLHQKLWCVNNGEVFCTLQRKICTLITIQLKRMQLDRSDVPRTTSLIDEPSYQSDMLGSVIRCEKSSCCLRLRMPVSILWWINQIFLNVFLSVKLLLDDSKRHVLIQLRNTQELSHAIITVAA